MSKTISRRVSPSGTSMRPVLTTLPASAKTLVPRLFPEPMAEYHSAPRLMIVGMLARVSTLLIRVGLPHSPEAAG